MAQSKASQTMSGGTEADPDLAPCGRDESEGDSLDTNLGAIRIHPHINPLPSREGFSLRTPQNGSGGRAVTVFDLERKTD